MSDNRKKSSKSRQIASKAPPQIVDFFSKPLSPNNEQSPSTSPSSSNDRKRKLSEQETASQNENPRTYAGTLRKNADKISKIQKTKKVATLVTTFFQGKSDDLDFVSPNKQVQFKTPPVIPKKKVTRKRKLPTKQTKIKNALETEIFEKVLLHHSNANGLNSDDLQMALALSRSITDTHSSSTVESSNISTVIRDAEPFRKEDIVRQTFQKFGFKKRDNNDYDYREFFTKSGTNKKWISKFTPLTRRCGNMQKEKFNKKVKNILQISEDLQNVNSEAIQEYGVTSSYLQQFYIHKSPSYNISLAEMETTVDKFYVNDLVPVSTLRCGCLLKNWADIPGRDVSPQRSISVTYNAEASSEIQNKISSSDTAEGQYEEIMASTKCDVDNVLELNSTIDVVNDANDNLELSNVDHITESSGCQGNSSSIQALHSPTKNEADQKSDDLMDISLDADTITNVDARNARQLSPDMFADYESSANNSLNDENHIADDSSSIPKDSLESRRLSFTSQIDERCENEELLNVTLPGSVPVKLNIVLSSDDFDQGDVKMSETQHRKLVHIPLINPFSKRLSFTERLELYNSDPALEMMDDDPIPCLELYKSDSASGMMDDDPIPCLELYNSDPASGMIDDDPIPCLELYKSDPASGMIDDDPISSLIDPSSQDSIVISDDEINYSLNHCRDDEGKNATKYRTLNMLSQESIELSDSEDDQNEIASQLPEDEIEERESFASIEIGNENDFGSEKSLDINIDDEIYNSNHSLNDEDLINLSIREMCQKDFIADSTTPSSTKTFSRTTSDMTFERKTWKPSKTPDKFNNFGDDEFDEFDMLVRGNRSQSPKPTASSIEISDDDFDELLESREDNICDDLSVLDSPASQAQSNEFIVESMDQIYEVRTGVLVSPKPDFDNMNSPTRLEHLKKYGLKTLSKRKAVICLEHIYNRLHPYIELDEHDDLDNILSKKEMHAIDSDKRIGDIAFSYDTCKPLAERDFDVLQENEDVFYLPSAPRAKKPWCLEPLHVAFHNLINSNATLHDDILLYKPIDIMGIRSLFKSIDLRYETNDIISFLDRKCITFKTDNKRNNAVKKS